MKFDKEHIIELVRSMPFVSDVTDKGECDGYWTLGLTFPIEGDEPLPFDMCINTIMSPMKTRGNSPVSFKNADLMAYPHIMHAGTLCMHTRDCVTWDERIREDLSALWEWIERYYIGGETDDHYEDLVVEDTKIKGRKIHFYYSQLDRIPQVGEYGVIAYTRLPGRSSNTTDTYLIQGLAGDDGTMSFGEWSDMYQNMAHAQGVYVMLNGSPSEYDKFAVESYDALEELCTEQQLAYLYEKLYKSSIEFSPVFWGYQTPSGKLRWLISYPDKSQPFVKGKKEIHEGEKHWKPSFVSVMMNNISSEECSYEQFYGRGRFPTTITDKKILLMGVGAIGSIVATTLVRGGARDISLCDFDMKHPVNVCRSEYLFTTGQTKKIDEMKQMLEWISPFVKVTTIEDLHIAFKLPPNITREQVKTLLDMYDIVFDCSIDGEMMWSIDQIDTKAQVVNLSISNEANELVCAFSPNISEFVTRIYTDVITETSGDMYNPEGCWSPTFKASYNDVQVMVQYAMRYILKMLSGEMEKANFMIREIGESLRLIRW